MPLPDWIAPLVPAKLGGAGPIGLDLDGGRLHGVQLEPQAGALRIRAACSAPMSAGDAAAQPDAKSRARSVRAALEGRGFRGRRVVTVLPDAALKLMVVNYESDAQADEAALIVTLVQERIDESIQDCVVDYLPLRTAEKHGARSALVAVASREDVIRHLELLRLAGLEVVALDIAPVAVRRLALQLGGPETTRNSLVIRCGARRSHLIMLSGRRLILYREIDYGEDQAVETLCKSLDMTPDAASEMLLRYGVLAGESSGAAWDDPAAALEISQTITEILKPGLYGLVEQVEMAAVYTASEWHGASVDEVLLLGGLARWPGVDRMLGQMSGVSSRALDPLALCGSEESAERFADLDAGLAVAAGLALRGMEGVE